MDTIFLLHKIYGRFAYNVAGMEIGMAPNITIENYDPKHLYTPKHLAPNSQTTISTSGVAWTMTGIGWALDMGNALTYDSGNTGRQRLQKMGIDTLAVVMNVAVAWGNGSWSCIGCIGTWRADCYRWCNRCRFNNLLWC